MCCGVVSTQRGVCVQNGGQRGANPIALPIPAPSKPSCLAAVHTQMLSNMQPHCPKQSPKKQTLTWSQKSCLESLGKGAVSPGLAGGRAGSLRGCTGALRACVHSQHHTRRGAGSDEHRERCPQHSWEEVIVSTCTMSVFIISCNKLSFWNCTWKGATLTGPAKAKLSRSLLNVNFIPRFSACLSEARERSQPIYTERGVGKSKH